jgi:hypothetical protein
MKNKINDMTAYFQKYMIELFDSPSKLNFTDNFVHWIFEFGMSRTLYFSLLTTAEMLVFKVFYLRNYSWIAGIDEYFLTNFATCCNIITVSIFYVIRICLEEMVKTRFYFQTFAKPYEAYKKVHFP